MRIKTMTVIKRTSVYLIGLFIMALGVSVSKASRLGVSPVNSIPAVLSDLFAVDMGVCTTAVFTGFIIIQFALLRRDFKPAALLQIIGSTVFGLFVSAANRAAGLFLPECTSYFMQLLYIAVSVMLVALGILLYIQADILSLPGEGVMQAVSAKTGLSLSTAKMIFDWSVVVIAAAISLIGTGTLSGIREGTVIAAFGVGLCLKGLSRLLRKPLCALLDKTPE